MIFERTKAGEIKALARLLNIAEKDLMYEAKLFQPDIKSLDQISDRSYSHILNQITYFVMLKSMGQAKVFSDIYEDEEEEDEEDPFRHCDKYEAKYLKEQREEAFVESMRYRDYCEAKYGWDCS